MHTLPSLGCRWCLGCLFTWIRRWDILPCNVNEIYFLTTIKIQLPSLYFYSLQIIAVTKLCWLSSKHWINIFLLIIVTGIFHGSFNWGWCKMVTSLLEKVNANCRGNCMLSYFSSNYKSQCFIIRFHFFHALVNGMYGIVHSCMSECLSVYGGWATCITSFTGAWHLTSAK